MKARIFYIAAIAACVAVMVLGMKFGYLNSLKGSWNAFSQFSNEKKDRPLIKLFSSGTVQEIEEAIKKRTDLNQKLSDGSTPLLIAAGKNNDPKVIELLLDNGAGVASVDSKGWTALMYAAGNPNPAITSVLLQKNLDVNAKSESGYTALMRSIHNSENAETLRLLIENGADVNASDDEGMTPLMEAVERKVFPASNRYKGTEFAALLIAAGADVNAKDPEGETALAKAVTHSEHSVIFTKMLIEAGASVNEHDNQGEPIFLKALNNILRNKQWGDIVKIIDGKRRRCEYIGQIRHNALDEGFNAGRNRYR
jgi:ankyrin repeat protein